MLNGMGRNDFLAALGDRWQVEHLRQNSVLEVALGRQHWLARLSSPLLRMPPLISEVFTFNVLCVLRKR